jgi:AcrR family transcriptional regulator
LAEEVRDVTRTRILRAAAGVLAERGLDTTMDDVAEAAAMGRRTIFRYFETRDRLIAAVMCDWLRSYSQQIPRPADGEDVETYLTELLSATHRLNAENGRIYWEIAALGDGLSDDLRAAAAERLKGRKNFVQGASATLWKMAGGKHRPPGWLVDAFAVHLSAFTTKALSGDFGRSPKEVAEVSTRMLLAALRVALEEER